MSDVTSADSRNSDGVNSSRRWSGELRRHGDCYFNGLLHKLLIICAPVRRQIKAVLSTGVVE